jgi:single-stranded-DNA-specific exonuclease
MPDQPAETPLASRILFHRGYRTAEEVRAFLAPSLASLHDPMLMLGMDAAVARLVKAIHGNESVLLYGDYDVDGTTSIVILTKALELLGAKAAFHVPHRLKDGYGMRPEVIDQAAEEGVRLIVSVDTGIRAGAVVRHARELGIDVIVTDHHLPEEDVPPAVAVLNPNQVGCTYPEKNLCGAGVAFKLIQALLAACEVPAEKARKLTESFLRMVAIATVADVVPLTGENRVIVRHGLDGLSNTPNIGLRALLEAAGFKPGDKLSAGQVGFRIGPRINAAGRMASARDVVELFLTSDTMRARDLARQLHELNTDRQETEAAMVREILAFCQQQPVTDDMAALIFAGDNWHRGVVGIVASRLVERFHRPAFVLGIDTEKGEAQGSGRSVSAFHLLEALESMPDLFAKFGGHRQAAGLTLTSGKIEEFRQRMTAYAAARLNPDDFVAKLHVDTEANLSELTDGSVAEVLQMQPFGFGNPAPLIAARGVRVLEPPKLIKEKHIRIRVAQNGRQLSMVGWNLAERSAEIAPGAELDVAFTLEDDEYSASRGYAPWAAVLKDFRAAASQFQTHAAG